MDSGAGGTGDSGVLVSARLVLRDRLSLRVSLSMNAARCASLCLLGAILGPSARSLLLEFLRLLEPNSPDAVDAVVISESAASLALLWGVHSEELIPPRTLSLKGTSTVP